MYYINDRLQHVGNINRVCFARINFRYYGNSGYKNSVTMDISEAKKVSIIDYLSGHGHDQTIPGWYYSPFRKENYPSFHITSIKNIWYDHGTGQGGNILDLVMSLDSVDLSGAIKILSEVKPTDQIIRYFPSGKSNESKTVIDRITELNNVQLLSYLDERQITHSVARKWCKEINYHIADRNYYSIGFPNHLGGWELRNRFCKNCVSPKSITVIKGTNEVILFEGFFDFLSFHTLYKMTTDQTKIVLNSLALLPEAIPLLTRARKIITFLDNDSAGQEACKKITERFPKKNVVHLSSSIYPTHNDLNDYLINRK